MAKLFQLWLKGAERGDALAQRMAGDLYLQKCRGGPFVDGRTAFGEARRWLSASADQGNTAAMVMMGGLLLQERGSLRDFRKPWIFSGGRRRKGMPMPNITLAYVCVAA